jgi:hypothetical protein
MVSCGDSTVYSGYVYDENKNPVPEVKVQIVGSDIYTMTDENGYFSIDHNNIGTEILIVKPGYSMQYYTPTSSSEKVELVLAEDE